MKTAKKSRPVKRRPRPAAVPACVPAPLDPPPVPREPPGPPGMDREFIRCLDSLLRAFRMKAGEVCSRNRMQAVCARTVARLQTSFPGFDPSALLPATAAGVFDMVEAILDEAPWWGRPVLRREMVRLLAELYNSSFDALREHGLLERVEQLYLTVKE